LADGRVGTALSHTGEATHSKRDSKCLGGQGIDVFGGALLWFEKAFDLGKHLLVAFGRFRGAGHRTQKLGTFACGVPMPIFTVMALPI
jgi:hypothetical protein